MSDPHYIDIYTLIYHATRSTTRDLDQHRKNLAFFLNLVNRLIDSADLVVDKIYLDWALAASRAIAAMDNASNVLTAIFAAMPSPSYPIAQKTKTSDK